MCLSVIAESTHTVKLMEKYLFHQNGNRQKYFVEIDCCKLKENNLHQ